MSDYVALTTAIVPLSVTICNNIFENRYISFILAAIVTFAAIFITILLQCKFTGTSQIEYKNSLINTSIFSLTTIVFGILVMFSSYIPMEMLMKSMLGVIVAMIISWGVYKSYVKINGNTSCKNN